MNDRTTITLLKVAGFALLILATVLLGMYMWADGSLWLVIIAIVCCFLSFGLTIVKAKIQARGK